MYEEDTHIPLILWNPKLAARGTRSQTIGSQIDINPTLATLLQLEPAATWQGHSLFSPSHPNRAYLYGWADHLLAVREGDFKYIFQPMEGTGQLHRLSTDPDEQTNVAAQFPDLCQTLRHRLAAWVDFESRHLAALRRQQP